MVEFRFRSVACWVALWCVAVLAATGAWDLPGYCVGMAAFAAASAVAMWRHRR